MVGQTIEGGEGVFEEGSCPAEYSTTCPGEETTEEGGCTFTMKKMHNEGGNCNAAGQMFVA